jgi:hypothetical protein
MKKLIALIAILISLSSFAQDAPQDVIVQKEKDYHYFIMFSDYAPDEVTFTITTEDGEVIVKDKTPQGVDMYGKTVLHYPYRTRGKRVTYYVTATHNGIESAPVEAIWSK